MSETYRKVRPLGRGPFATVYEGRDLSLGRAVAIKELAQPFAGDPKVVAAFVERAGAMARVSHGQLLTLHGIDTSHEGPWLISELADRTLRDAPAHGALQPEQVEQLLLQVLPALGALHAGGLTHGSIKPGNLFVCGMLYKLGDFGFTAADGGPTADTLSPPRYMAPEEIAGREARTAAADLYSLGLVAYELLLGEARFTQAVIGSMQAGAANAAAGEAGGELELWLRFHRAAGDLPPPSVLDPQVPEALSRVVATLARKDPTARYPSCDAALADLLGRGAPASDAGAGAGRAEPTAAMPIAKRRSLALPLTAAASLAAVLLLLAVLLLRNRDPTVEIASNPPGARILYEEKEMGVTPARLRLKVGTTLTLRKEGYRDGEVRLAAADQKALHAELARRVVAAAAPPAPAADPFAAARIVDPLALAAELLRLRGGDAGLKLDFEPPAAGAVPRLPLGSPLHFQVLAATTGSLALFVLSADGTVFCVYPSATHAAVAVAAGRGVELPLPEDARVGEIRTGEPLGRDLIFALFSVAPLPPLPAGDAANRWLTEYRFVAGPGNPTLAFAQWVAAVRGQRGTALSALEMEVVPR